MNESQHSAHSPELDQDAALASAAIDLTEEFEGVFTHETVTDVLQRSYDELAAHATVRAFLPLLAAKYTRQRLHASSLHAGLAADGKPVVLFLCVHNAGKSQMALGFFKALAGDNAIGWSGGSEPGSGLNQFSVEAMAERGIDISGEFPKRWTEETLRAADVIVTMGCGDTCPVYPHTRYLDWAIDAPPGTSIENVRPVRDAIEVKVRELLAELGVDAADAAALDTASAAEKTVAP